jgi:hypothetical protein
MIPKNDGLMVFYLVVWVLFISTSLGYPSQVKAEERVAFLVGIKNYKEAPLSNTIRDTEIILFELKRATQMRCSAPANMWNSIYYTVGMRILAYSGIRGQWLWVTLGHN